jgi:hypothetical protein
MTWQIRTMAANSVRSDHWWVAAGVWLALALPGCESPAPTTLHGRVAFQGSPVSEAMIVFSSGVTAAHVTARLGPEGEYAVRTASGPGLPPGGYRVWVSPPLVDAPMGSIRAAPAPPPRTDIPSKYRSAATTSLFVMLEEGDNQFDVNMLPDAALPAEPPAKTEKPEKPSTAPPAKPETSPGEKKTDAGQG